MFEHAWRVTGKKAGYNFKLFDLMELLQKLTLIIKIVCSHIRTLTDVSKFGLFGCKLDGSVNGCRSW